VLVASSEGISLVSAAAKLLAGGRCDARADARPCGRNSPQGDAMRTISCCVLIVHIVVVPHMPDVQRSAIRLGA
jgi:hypothetical protein